MYLYQTETFWKVGEMMTICTAVVITATIVKLSFLRPDTLLKNEFQEEVLRRREYIDETC